MRHGGIGVIEEGKLKGRRFVIPSEALVEKGAIFGQPNFSKACLIHQKFIPNHGCPDCSVEVEQQEALGKEIGL